jgi:tRNA1(Val) A37 N6-methylase TrmN6
MRHERHRLNGNADCTAALPLLPPHRMTTPEQILAQEPDGWPADAERARFAGDWFIWQRKRGHRTSTDDMLTAWAAVCRAQRPVQRYCDLGCGIGSVLLLTANALRPTESLGVEAQAQSVELARRTLAELPDPPNLRILHGDFRDVTVERVGLFDLVTGSPPYLPLGTGVLSPDAQRRACRFELRGGVEAYLETAARILSPVGEVHLVFQTLWAPRVLAAANAAGLQLQWQLDVHMREGRAEPFLSTFSFARAPADALQGGGTPRHTTMTIRDARGEVTPEYQQLRTDLHLA